MTNLLKTPALRELEDLRRKLKRRKRSKLKKDLREFFWLVLGIVTGTLIVDLIYLIKRLLS